MSRLMTLIAVALIIATGAAAQDLAELEVDHALTFDFPTPHTDWAQPYAGERTRVLFFTDGRGTNPRECVELMQRFDLDAEAVFCPDRGFLGIALARWGYRHPAHERAARPAVGLLRVPEDEPGAHVRGAAVQAA